METYNTNKIGGNAKAPQANAGPDADSSQSMDFQRATICPPQTAHMDHRWSPLEVVLCEFEELNPVEHFNRMPTGTVVIADVGLDDRFTDGR